MTILKKDLQELNKDIKALSKTVDNLLKAFEKSEKSTTGKKTKAKSVKAKTTKRAPAKKAPAKKGTAKPTATDQVLKIIMGRKRGIDAPTLMKKTGFDNKKISNILHRAFKAGKIKRMDRGKYIGA